MHSNKLWIRSSYPFALHQSITVEICFVLGEITLLNFSVENKNKFMFKLKVVHL